MKATLRLFFSFVLLCLFHTSFAQERLSVSGTVTDQNQIPIPGVNIVVEGTSNGTATNFDGQFSIEVQQGQTLVFSSVGFQSKSVVVTTDTLTVTLNAGTALDEVIVTGYGKQTRSKLTTSVAKMDTRVLETSARSNAATALQGEIPGLKITNATGQPGSTPQITLRGGTGFNGSGSPLILIDGVPGSFYALNSDDIASIEVLKDAAATAIYGARAANGVILVTTKKGKSGKTTITYKQTYSFNYHRDLPNYLNAADFITYNRQAVLYYNEVTGRTNFNATFLDGATAFGTGNNTTNSPFTTMYLNSNNEYLLNYPGWSTVVDPVDPSKKILFKNNPVNELIYRPSHTTDHYLSFQGGNEKGSFYSSLGYMKNEGLILGSGFNRFTGKFTGSYNIYDNLRVTANIIYAHSNLNQSPLGSNDRVFRRFAGQPPTSRTYNNNPDGSLSDVLNPGTNLGFGNPLYYIDKFKRSNLEQRITASMGVEWDIIPDLTLSVRGSHFAINNLNESFNKAYLNGGSLIDTRNASASTDKVLRNQLTGTLDYTHTFDKHYLSVLIGTEYYSNKDYSLSAATKNSPTDLIPTMNAGAEADGVPYSFWTRNVISSAFGRVNYDYDDKYLLGFTFRYDGSSKLGNEKFGFFPGVSVGWNAQNEDFIKYSDLADYISQLKPRISYGVNGNLSVLGNFTSFGSYGSQGVYDGSTGYGNTTLPNYNLKWERSKTLNFGLDLSLFDNRLSFIADYYIRDVENKLATLTLPYWTGFSGITTNNGSLRNKGFELQFKADIIRSKDFTWSIHGALSKVKRYVVKLPENDNPNNRQGGAQIYNPATGELEWVGGLQEGQRVGTDLVITYVQDHIYKDADDVAQDADIRDDILPDPYKRYPGDVAWKDVNGDRIINSYDRQVIGRTTPDFFGGLSTTLNYKGFSLYVKTDFAVGHLIYNHIRGKGLAQTQGNLNPDALVLQSWTPDNRNTNIPRYVFTDPQGNIFRGSEATVNSQFWEKGDYLALREATLSYNLPKEWFNNFFQQFQVYVTGSNLYYFKSYSGPSPEEGGYQYGEFPMPRTLTLGLTMKI